MAIQSIKRAVRPMIKACALVLGASLCSTIANAQDSSTSDVTITKAETVQISNIDDWVFGIFGANDTITGITYRWDEECVYSSTGAYNVQIISANGGPNLRLISGSGDEMAYEMWAFHRRGTQYRLDGPHTTTTTTFANLSGSQSLTCADENVPGVNLWFTPVVRGAAFNPAPPGIYQDLMTIVVTPE